MNKDQLEAIRKMKEHFEAVRQARKTGAPLPKPPAGMPPFPFKNRPMIPAPSAPDPLLQWFLEDIPPREFHDLLTSTISHLKIKGYRPGHVPRSEGIKILKTRYLKEPAFRPKIITLWLKARQKERQALRILNPADIQKNPWQVVERFGFPLTIWLFLLSPHSVLRMKASEMIKEVAAKQGRMEELLARAKEQSASSENIWALPDVSHDDEVTRMQNEVEQILSERDHWQQEAASEKQKSEKQAAEIRQWQEEKQKSDKARTAAEQSLQAMEAKAHDLQSQLDNLRQAETSLNHMQKQIKEMERDKGLLSAEKDKWQNEAGSKEKELNGIEQKYQEQARTLFFLKLFLKDPALPPEPEKAPSPVLPYQGQVIFLVTNEDPSPYFEAGKKTGVTLLVYDGQSLNQQFEKFLDQAWRAVLWGEADLFHDGILKALRSASKPLIVLPSLGPEKFEQFLTAAAAEIEKLS